MVRVYSLCDLVTVKGVIQPKTLGGWFISWACFGLY